MEKFPKFNKYWPCGFCLHFLGFDHHDARLSIDTQFFQGTKNRVTRGLTVVVNKVIFPLLNKMK